MSNYTGKYEHKHVMMLRVYDALKEYPCGATCYQIAHHLGYGHSRIRVLLNWLVAEYPHLVTYDLEQHWSGADKKVYRVKGE